MLQMCDDHNDDQLAIVLSHEIAHALCGHVVRSPIHEHNQHHILNILYYLRPKS